MKRETVFAIALGILLGIGIGIFVLFQSGNGDETKVIPVSSDSNNKIVKTVSTSDKLFLHIAEPQENAVVTTNEVVIKGKVQKNSLIVVQSQINSEIFKNEKEDFSVTFPLALGENTISINAYSGSSTPEEISIKVYYIEE